MVHISFITETVTHYSLLTTKEEALGLFSRYGIHLQPCDIIARTLPIGNLRFEDNGTIYALPE